VLKVEVLSAEPWATWGWNAIRAGKGTLGKTPEYADLPGETVIIPIDLQRQTATPPWSNGRVGYHSSQRYFAAKTSVDDCQCGPCNQTNTRE
jgi:hypothetical protein